MCTHLHRCKEEGIQIKWVCSIFSYFEKSSGYNLNRRKKKRIETAFRKEFFKKDLYYYLLKRTTSLFNLKYPKKACTIFFPVFQIVNADRAAKDA